VRELLSEGGIELEDTMQIRAAHAVGETIEVKEIEEADARTLKVSGCELSGLAWRRPVGAM
jgi:hypothetical protein